MSVLTDMQLDHLRKNVKCIYTGESIDMIKYKFYEDGRHINTSYSMTVDEYGESICTLDEKIAKDKKFFKNSVFRADRVDVYVDNALYTQITL